MRGFIVVPLTFHYQYSNLSTINQGSTARFQLRSSVCLLQLAVSVAVTLNRRSLLIALSSAVPTGATRSYIVRNDEKLSACLS